MSIEHFLFSKGTKFPQSCHLVTLSHPETDYEVKPANFLGPKDGHCTFVVSGMTLLTPGSSLGRDISPAPSKPQHGTWLSIHTHWPRDLPTQYPVSPYEVGLTPPGLPDLWAQHDPVATPPVSLSQSWCHPLPFFLPLSQLPLMPRPQTWWFSWERPLLYMVTGSANWSTVVPDPRSAKPELFPGVFFSRKELGFLK